MENIESTAQDVFLRFSQAMYEWNILSLELKRNDSMSDDEKIIIRKEKLDKIFEEYCTIRKRTYGRQAGYNFKNPPEYNLETNNILSSVVEGNKAFIEVQETVGFNRKLKYTLHKKADGWRVDKREVYDDVFKNKWITDIL
ncbi:NTF2 fold immunity protein [Bacteroides sp. 224]|uniref:NTF2 fold immunity protein n=1 Tax=Bacteroides sp. 224 TaxID=2302936 RepID=UPI0013D55001|nr:NTF2 fold immunity protein [Bacteroides sp. 224]NDV66709.1 hypothetical protein [Bacteroides sp. 224]